MPGSTGCACDKCAQNCCPTLKPTTIITVPPSHTGTKVADSFTYIDTTVRLHIVYLLLEDVAKDRNDRLLLSYSAKQSCETLSKTRSKTQSQRVIATPGTDFSILGSGIKKFVIPGCHFRD